MIRVCHVTTVHQVKDTRIYHKECAALAKAGYDVKLVAVNAADKHSDYEQVEIVSVDLPPTSKFVRVWRNPRKVLSTVINLDPVVAHLHDPELLMIAPALKRAGIKVVYDAHEDVPKQLLTKDWIPKPIRRLAAQVVQRIEERTMPHLDAVVTVVEGVVNRLGRLHSKVVLVKNFPEVDALPTPATWESKRNEVCYIGDLTHIRGIHECVQAMDGKAARFQLAGRWSDKGLREVCMESGGWAQVDELGFITRKEAMEVLQRCKIGLILFHPAPNHMDALPNKLFEYMAAGIPVVASDFGWMKKVVEKHQCGILVDPWSPTRIGKAIDYLLQNESEAEEMGRRGREAVMKTYNWASEEKKLTELYSSLTTT